MTSPEDALTAAYREAAPLMTAIAPDLEIICASLGGLEMVARHAAPTPRDKDNVSTLVHGIAQTIEALTQVATTYHAVVGELVSSEDVREREVQLE